MELKKYGWRYTALISMALCLARVAPSSAHYLFASTGMELVSVRNLL